MDLESAELGESGWKKKKNSAWAMARKKDLQDAEKEILEKLQDETSGRTKGLNKMVVWTMY